MFLRNGRFYHTAYIPRISLMLSFMNSEGRGVSEGFTTLLAFIGFLSSVHPHVDFQGLGTREGLPTVLAFIRLPFSMSPFMFPEPR